MTIGKPSSSATFETSEYRGIFTNTVGETYGFTGTTERLALPLPDEANENYELVGKATEITEFAMGTTEQGVIGAQKLANALSGTNFKILEGGNVTELAGHGLTALSAAFTIADARANGWKGHHIADLFIDVAVTALEITASILEWSTPNGWIVGSTLFAANVISECTTHKSLTENLFDKK